MKCTHTAHAHTCRQTNVTNKQTQKIKSRHTRHMQHTYTHTHLNTYEQLPIYMINYIENKIKKTALPCTVHCTNTLSLLTFRILHAHPDSLEFLC